MKRLLAGIPFAVFTLSAFLAARSDAKLETIEQIIPGVWFRQGDLDQRPVFSKLMLVEGLVQSILTEPWFTPLSETTSL